MTAKTLRVLGYVRRSTDKQAMSPETQARQLRDAAQGRPQANPARE